MYDDDDDDDDNAAPLGGCGEGTCKPIVASCCRPVIRQHRRSVVKSDQCVCVLDCYLCTRLPLW